MNLRLNISARSPREAQPATMAPMRSSRSRAMVFFCLLILLGTWNLELGTCARAAQMRFGPYTNFDGSPITNTVIIVKPIGDPAVDANGNAAAMNGFPIRITLGADGMFTNTLQNQNYQVTNNLGTPGYFGKGYCFRAPLDSGPTVYSTTAAGILITGLNYFVTLNGGTNGGSVTFNSVTNALGYVPLNNALSNFYATLAQATNVANAQLLAPSNALYSIFNTRLALGITNAFGTNATVPSLANQVLHIPTNWDAAGLAYTVGANATNLVNAASNTLNGDYSAKFALAITNAFGTNATVPSLANQVLHIPTNWDAAGLAYTVGASATNFVNATSNVLQVSKVNVTNGLALNLEAVGQFSVTNIAGIANSLGADDISLSTSNGNFTITTSDEGVAGGTFTVNASGSSSLRDAVGDEVNVNGLGAVNLFSGSDMIYLWGPGANFANVTNVYFLRPAPATGHTNLLFELADGSLASGDLANFASASFFSNTITNAYGTNALTLSVSGRNIYAPTNFDIKGGSNVLYALNTTSSNALALLNSTASNAVASQTITASNNLRALIAAKAPTNAPYLFNAIAYQSLSVTNISGINNGLGHDDIAMTSTNGSITLTAQTNGTGDGAVTLLAVNGVDLQGENGNSSVSVNGSQGGVFIDSDDANLHNGKIILQSPGGTKFQNNGGPVTVFNLIDSPGATNVILETTSGQVLGTPLSSFLLAGDARAGITNAYGTNRATVLVANQSIFIPTNWDYAGGSNILYGRETTASNFLSAALSASSNFLSAVKLNKTNDTSYGQSATNFSLLGNVGFGPAGLSTNIISGTNFLAFVNAGSGIATNGAFLWNSNAGAYTNWLTGAIVTNNTSAWLLQTNGVTLYSLSGSSPIGTYSAINGATPAPLGVFTAAINDHMVMLGYFSVTNINAISNSIVTTITIATTNTFIANTNGNGTNTSLWGQTIIHQPSFVFDSVIGGTNNNKGAGFYDALLAGMGNSTTFGTVGMTIVGGTNNSQVVIGAPPIFDTIVGGTGHREGSSYGFIGGGAQNTISNLSDYGSIPGGNNNFIGGGAGTRSANGGMIGGGQYNAIIPTRDSGADNSSVLGGLSNVVYGANSIAFGRNAKATNDNVLVWSDGTYTVSTTNSQAILSATNGLALTGPMWLSGSALTNSGIYYPSNTFSLFSVTNAMPNFAYWMGSSNGILTILYYSNGVPYQKALWP